MKSFHRFNKNLLLLLLFLHVLNGKMSFAQISGSLFMIPDNFYAQMYNPSYTRIDGASAFSAGGFAGFSFFNQGNFKIADLITTYERSPVIDFENFYKNINKNNFFRQELSIPMSFLSIPLKKGVFSLYYKENVSSVLKFKQDILEFFNNGNYMEKYSNFNSDEIKLLTTGYREFAFGYAKNLNENINFGLRTKLLFGAILIDAVNWNYGISTNEKGEIVNLNSGGTGHLMMPFPMVLRADNTIFSVDIENAVANYFSTFQNPGLAIDLGATFYAGDNSNFSFVLRDLGGIWYRNKSYNMHQSINYEFEGFDLLNSIRYPEEPGYTNPQTLVALVKDSIRLIYHPVVEDYNFFFGIAAKTILHYQYQSSEILSFGVTNQSAFQKNNFQNILTLTAMHSWPNFSVFENLNLHGASDVSIGGGFQYEGDFFQAFLATDNIIAFYHPANNKTFSVTAGICILLNHKKFTDPEKQNNKGLKTRKGKISPDLPFYKELRELR